MLAFIQNSYRFVLYSLFYLGAYSSNAQLTIQKDQYLVDTTLHLILCNQPPATIPPATTTIAFDKPYVFALPMTTLQIGTAYDVVANQVHYQLYFTHLPLINLSVNKPIGDDYEYGSLTVADTVGKAIRSNLGIKLRGSYSKTFPKKSYHLQLWTDTTGVTTQNKALLGMRSDQTWLLLALYNEKLRLNNKISHDLWLKMDTLYYSQQEPDAHAGIRSKYVDVFQNGAYQGVYLLAEDLDRKELALKKATATDAGGELYKGESWDQGTLFTGLAPRPTSPTPDWSGWELTYPDTTNWVNLYEFTDFVVNAPDSSFKQQIATRLREDNFADYFIFLNLLRAEDNTGKNLYLARYDQHEPYFISPWDLDGTWGYYWDGSRRNITDDILANALFNRLLSVTADFKLLTASRWFFLRQSTLSLESLYRAIDVTYTYLQTNGVYKRESLVWAGPLLSSGPDELNYLKTWTSERVTYLDTYFKRLAQTQPMLYNFTALAVNQTAVLTWRANCLAVSSFAVERSADGVSWNTISSNAIPSTDSLPCQYSFTDPTPNPGNVYYRVKITDKLNTSSYTPSRELNFDLPVTIFPNPATTSVEVDGNVNKVAVYSLTGALLHESATGSPTRVNVSGLSAGMYWLRVYQTNGTVSRHKLVVNR